MTFLQPFLLLGLAAAAIPVVLHLLTLRRLRVVEFSTLTFLKELQRSRIRRLQIQQWLLLILRTLLIILLVIAFARPTTQGTLPRMLGSEPQTSAVLLVDDSYSMTAIDNEGELLRQARTAAEGILAALRPDDDVILLPLSQARSSDDGSSLVRRVPQVKSELQRLIPSAVTRSLSDGLRMSARILGNSRNVNKELYILSDLQSGLFPPSTLPREALFEPNVRVFPVRLGDRVPRNLSVTTPSFPGSFIDRARPFPLRVDASNRATTALTANISLFRDEERIDQRSQELEPLATRSMELSLSGAQPGFVSAQVTLEGDDLDFDNVLHIAFRVRPTLRVLLVGASEDLRYIRLALETRSDPASTALTLRQTDLSHLTGTDLSASDVAIISTPLAKDDPALDRLSESLRGGLGIVLVPPSGVTESLNGFLRRVGMSQIDSVRPDLPAGTTLSFQQTDIDHPLFAGIFAPPAGGGQGRTRPSVASPEITRSILLTPPQGVLPVITLSDGRPYLVEHAVGQGRLIVFSTALTPEWSTLPRQGLFVPLLHRVVARATRSQDVRPHVNAGEDAVIVLAERPDGPVQVVRPNGSSSPAIPSIGPEGSTIRVTDTRVPGFYKITNGTKEIDRFAVDIDPSESDTRPATDEQITALWASLGLTDRQVHPLRHDAAMDRVVEEARRGTELWKHFLGAALLIAILESLVARRWSSRTTAPATA